MPAAPPKPIQIAARHLLCAAPLRQSSLLFALTKHLLYTKFRDPGEEPKLHLFGQLKRVTKQWLDRFAYTYRA